MELKTRQKECLIEAVGGRAGSRHGDFAGSGAWKMISPKRRRRTIAKVRGRFGPQKVLERRTCCVFDLPCRVPNDTRRAGRMMYHVDFVRCVPWPDNIHALQPNVFSATRGTPLVGK